MKLSNVTTAIGLIAALGAATGCDNKEARNAARTVSATLSPEDCANLISEVSERRDKVIDPVFNECLRAMPSLKGALESDDDESEDELLDKGGDCVEIVEKNCKQ